VPSSRPRTGTPAAERLPGARNLSLGLHRRQPGRGEGEGGASHAPVCGPSYSPPWSPPPSSGRCGRSGRWVRGTAPPWDRGPPPAGGADVRGGGEAHEEPESGWQRPSIATLELTMVGCEYWSQNGCRLEGQVRKTGWSPGTRRSPLSVLVIAGGILTSGCAPDREPKPQDTRPIPVVYSVKFPGGEGGGVRIAFRLPDGTVNHVRASTPWFSELLYFRRGDPLVIEAVAMGDYELTSLQCVAISEPDNPEGTTYGASSAGKCRAKGKAGRHLSP
jgi:hypothetical protein